MYKKLFFKILVVITIITTVNARNGYDPLTFDVKENEFVYRYDNNQCEVLAFSYRMWLVKQVRTGLVYINEYGENEAGRYTELLFEDENKTLSVFSTYGECKYFEEYIIQNRGILTDIKKYIGLRYTLIDKK